MPKKEKNSTVQKEIIGDSVKTFLFGDDATKMKTDTVADGAVCVCCVLCVVCCVLCVVCCVLCVLFVMMIRLKDTRDRGTASRVTT